MFAAEDKYSYFASTPLYNTLFDIFSDATAFNGRLLIKRHNYICVIMLLYLDEYLVNR
jgi:hypothetical protein